jgi:hypothetical protein
MSPKSVLYKDEQEKLADKIIEILELDEDNSITLYELDRDPDKQEKIMELAPEVRTFFTYTCIMGVKQDLKRSWLSVMKHVTKVKYKLISSEVRFQVGDKKIKTVRYYFMEKTN